MKPVKLEFCGVNSFSEPAVIDFTDLLEFGIFGIFGDTGSGKSTILDCIGFALYGDVFRLGQRSSSIADIINYKLDKAYAHYEFEIVYEGKRRTFRVEREVRRKNAVQNARVYEVKDGALVALAEGVRECNALIERIVGLEQRDFEKCIALPQGEFAQFVKSARGDRLKLVSRLFDLEKYGEALTKRASARFHTAKEEADLIEVQLKPYAEVTQADVKRRKEEISALETEEKSLAAALQRARSEEKRLTALAERKAAAERARATYASLLAQKETMEQTERELLRLERAGEVVTLDGERERAERRYREAREAYAATRNAREEANAALRALAGYDEEAAEAEIAALTERAARAAEAGERERRRAAAEKNAARAAAEYAEEAKQFVGFSYERERDEIEKKLAALGEGDLNAFVTARGKDALFREEYGTFREELLTLTEKHPHIGEDTAPLIIKYARLSSGDGEDFAAVKSAYDEREKAREALRKALIDLETYRGKYALHLQRMQQLQSDFRRYKEELSSYPKEETEGKTQETLRRQLEEKRRARREYGANKRQAEQKLSEAEVALAAAEVSGKAAAEALTEANARYKAACERGGFQSAEEARALVTKFGDAAEAKAHLEAYRKQFAAAEERQREYEGENFSEADGLERAKEVAQETEEREREVGKTLALRRADLARAEKQLGEKRELERAYSAKKQETETAERLKKLLDGNKFMEFVAEECLQSVASGASARLLSLTGGRYFLRYDGGFLVGDNFNGGQTRGVYTLSGGETFLVSLSLALALSAEICAKSLRPIEFFFLDEGFGTLDEHLVDVVLDSLEKLKGEHFSIGIISHVEELKHRIDKKLLVKKATEKYGSRIQAE